MKAVARLSVLIASAALALAGCGSDEGEAEAAAPEASVTPTGPSPDSTPGRAGSEGATHTWRVLIKDEPPFGILASPDGSSCVLTPEAAPVAVAWFDADRDLKLGEGIYDDVAGVFVEDACTIGLQFPKVEDQGSLRFSVTVGGRTLGEATMTAEEIAEVPADQPITITLTD